MYERQSKQQFYSNRHARSREFRVGEAVYVRNFGVDSNGFWVISVHLWEMCQLMLLSMMVKNSDVTVIFFTIINDNLVKRESKITKN